MLGDEEKRHRGKNEKSEKTKVKKERKKSWGDVHPHWLKKYIELNIEMNLRYCKGLFVEITLFRFQITLFTRFVRIYFMRSLSGYLLHF